jgi:hypothetical protein
VTVSILTVTFSIAVEPFAYLKATLEAIAEGHPAAQIDELMPWNFQKSA